MSEPNDVRRYNSGFIGTQQQLVNALRYDEPCGRALARAIRMAAAEEIETLRASLSIWRETEGEA